MKKHLLIFTLLATAAACSPAAAQSVPMFSGLYGITVRLFCPETSSYPGLYVEKFITADFNPSPNDPYSGTVTTNGYIASTPLNIPASQISTSITTTSLVNSTSNFSNTATALTADNVTWNIIYTQVKGSTQIAQTYFTNGLFPMHGDPSACTGSASGARM